MQRILTILAVVVVSATCSSASAALTMVTSGGLTFTSLSPDLGFISATGTGSQVDPLILTEDVTGLDVTMSIRGFTSNTPNFVPPYTTGFFLQKVVTNSTGQTWNFYDHELQEVLGTPSANGDGLSFAQGLGSVRPFTSDMFTTVNEVVDPRDFVNFSGGSVAPGDTVTFNLVITDNSPVSLFYLRQRPDFQAGEVAAPEAASVMIWSVLGISMAGAGWYRKSKSCASRAA